MGKIFISYRRKDIDFATRIHEGLEKRLDADIFKDERIDGQDYEEVLTREIQSCSVFLLVITDNTLDPQRLQNPKDWIRREIQLALRHEKPFAIAFHGAQTTSKTFDYISNQKRLATIQQTKIVPEQFDASVDSLAKHIENISERTIQISVSLPDPQPAGSSSISAGGDIEQHGTFNVLTSGSNNTFTMIEEVVNAENPERAAMQKIRMIRDEMEIRQDNIDDLYHEFGQDKRQMPNPERLIWIGALNLGMIVLAAAFYKFLCFPALLLVLLNMFMRRQASNKFYKLKRAEIAKLEKQQARASDLIGQLNNIIDRSDYGAVTA